MTQRIVLDGVEIAWDVWGDPNAPTLVICHGYGGTAHNFVEPIAALAADWRVIAYDQRGHGLSENLGELAGYSADQLSADLNALIEATCLAPVTVVGHSLGGRVALGALLARPELYRSLILSDTTAWSFRPENEVFRNLIGAVFESFDPAAGAAKPRRSLDRRRAWSKRGPRQSGRRVQKNSWRWPTRTH